MAGEALKKAKAKGVELLLPVDNVLADAFSADAKTQIWNSSVNFPADWQGLDIGPKSIAAIEKIVAGARTIVWNGPAGVFEFPRFAVGTNAIAEAVAANRDAISIVGGGDSVAAVKQAGSCGPDHAHLDRRRGEPGVSGGEETAWCRGFDREVASSLL
jgi:phosphoglycerate kinase